MRSTGILWMSDVGACRIITAPPISLSSVPSSCPAWVLRRPASNAQMLILQLRYVYMHSFGRRDISAPENTAPGFPTRNFQADN